MPGVDLQKIRTRTIDREAFRSQSTGLLSVHCVISDNKAGSGVIGAGSSGGGISASGQQYGSPFMKADF